MFDTLAKSQGAYRATDSRQRNVMAKMCKGQSMMPRKKKDNLSQDERKENALRPCPYLGYDRDELGMYLLSRGAYKIAESQFRRAVWLNPFEPAFKEHLAWCLYKLGRDIEAYDWATKVLSLDPDSLENKHLIELLERKLGIREPKRPGVHK
jgi:tetratricopeptide (TPR) repeat protein